MRAEELLQLVRHRPFIPMRLHMTDGETYEIRHPEMCLVQRQRVDVGLDPDPKSGVLDRVEHLSLIHIVRVENLEAPVDPSKSNGGPGA